MIRTKKSKFSKILVTMLATAVLGALALPTVAAAANTNPTGDQYNNTRDQIATLAESSGGGPTDPSESADDPVGSLPFTGLDVLGLFAVAIVFAGSGLLLQRAVRKQ